MTCCFREDFIQHAMSAIITTLTHGCENTVSKSCLTNVKRVMKGTGSSRLLVKIGEVFPYCGQKSLHHGCAKTAQF